MNMSKYTEKTHIIIFQNKFENITNDALSIDRILKWDITYPENYENDSVY